MLKQSSRNLSFFALLCLAMVLIGCLPAQPEIETLNSTIAEMQFSYPSDWKIAGIEVKEDQGVTTEVITLRDSQNRQYPWVPKLGFRTEPSQGKSLLEAFQDSLTMQRLQHSGKASREAIVELETQPFLASIGGRDQIRTIMVYFWGAGEEVVFPFSECAYFAAIQLDDETIGILAFSLPPEADIPDTDVPERYCAGIDSPVVTLLMDSFK